MKVKINRPKNAAKKVSLYTVNVARMDRYLSQSKTELLKRIHPVEPRHAEYDGVLAGPISRVRVLK